MQKVLGRILLCCLATVVAVGVNMVSSKVFAAASLKAFEIQVEGNVRTFTVLEPMKNTKEKAVPLVVVLHGAGGTGTGIIQETGWDRKAEEMGFAVVFPDALRANLEDEASFLVNPQIWNDGSGRGTGLTRVGNDVLFLSLMMEQITSNYNIDQRAIYLTGFSNGASMGFKAVSELPGRFSAFAPVSGHFWHQPGFAILKQPIPTLFIAGTDDPVNPLQGGTIKLPWGTFEQPPLLQNIDQWVRRNGHSKGLKPATGRPGLQVLQGVNGSHIPVRIYLVDGLGHLWPGGKRIFPEEFIGKDPGVLNATDVIWEFFSEIGAHKQ